jgi:hypothetical protein
VPPRYASIVAVEYYPSGEHAVMFIAYNEPPDVEPYVVLCENTPDGWVAGRGVSAGGMPWMRASEHGSLGVQTTWNPRTVWWEVPSPEEPERAADDSW